ncbi:MAG: hypothetical protein RBT22_11095 [Aliarcobacter sp.]|jgi:hypothetical protein|nr:hypothetical protein [Aliarcobacter sp.]
MEELTNKYNINISNAFTYEDELDNKLKSYIVVKIKNEYNDNMNYVVLNEFDRVEVDLINTEYVNKEKLNNKYELIDKDKNIDNLINRINEKGGEQSFFGIDSTSICVMAYIEELKEFINKNLVKDFENEFGVNINITYIGSI